MPRKNSKAINIAQTLQVMADEWLITSVISVAHYNGDGNIEVGDTVEVDEDGEYLGVEKFAVHYLVLLAGVVVDKGSLEVNGAELVTLMGKNPRARNAIKTAGYDALERGNIAPASSIVS